MSEWIEIPLPPCGNNLFINLPRGGRAPKAAYKRWQAEAIPLIALQASRGRVAGPYALHIRAGRPDRRKRDVDNLIKPVSDAAVKAALVDDDSLCQRVTCEWVSGIKGVRLLVLPTTQVPL